MKLVKCSSKYDILVNKDNPLDRFYVPENLIRISSRIKAYVNPNYPLRLEETTYINFKQLQEEALNNGFDLEVSSGYRDFDYQQQVLNHHVKLMGNDAYKVVSLPGTSDHQTALALDYWLYRKEKREEMSDAELAAFEDRKNDAYLWVEQNAHNYGFIIRYPVAPSGNSNDVHPTTKMRHEPWHLRFVGHDVASGMYDEKRPLVLEEYHKLIKRRG